MQEIKIQTTRAGGIDRYRERDREMADLQALHQPLADILAAQAPDTVMTAVVPTVSQQGSRSCI